MSERVVLAVLLLLILGLIFVWSLCMVIKTDRLERDRDKLDYDPGCDPVSLRNAGRQGRDA